MVDRRYLMPFIFFFCSVSISISGKLDWVLKLNMYNYLLQLLLLFFFCVPVILNLSFCYFLQVRKECKEPEAEAAISRNVEIFTN